MRFLRRWKTQILLFFSVVGPGFITANVDNDAGGILTYSQAGAQFGHMLLWTMIPITVALIVVQEMCARMGAVTGKGLSDLIREEYGLRITFLMMLGILICNFGNVVTEFAGIAASMELFGVSRYISVPICAVIVWLIVVKGQYKTVEKVFLAASFFYLTYIFAGVLAKPAWLDAITATVTPPHLAAFKQHSYLYLVIGLVGTTIAPWMQFYLQASVVEKGVTRRQYKASQLDVVVGCIFTDVVAWFIIVACAATLYVHGHRDIRDAADGAQGRGRSGDSPARSASGQDFRTVAGRQWRRAAVCADLHAVTHQQERTYGGAYQHPKFQRHRVGDDCHHDRTDVDTALEQPAGRIGIVQKR